MHGYQSIKFSLFYFTYNVWRTNNIFLMKKNTLRLRAENLKEILILLPLRENKNWRKLVPACRSSVSNFQYAFSIHYYSAAFFITATSAKFSCQTEERKFNKHKNADSPETLSEPRQINTTSVLSLNSYYFHFSCKLHRDWCSYQILNKL